MTRNSVKSEPEILSGSSGGQETAVESTGKVKGKSFTSQQHSISADKIGKSTPNKRENNNKSMKKGQKLLENTMTSSFTDRSENNAMKTSVNSNNNTNTRSSSTRSSSSNNYAIVGIRSETSKEICRTGLLKTLLTFLLHKEAIVRHAALAVCQLHYKICTHQSNTASLALLWQSVLEQGLVPVLEVIQLGVPIYSQKDGGDDQVVLFPETNVRSFSLDLLNSLAANLNQGEFLRSKLLSSFGLNTGGNSHTLQINVLVGLLHSCSRSDTLGRRFWGSPSRSNSTQGSDMYNALKTLMQELLSSNAESFEGFLTLLQSIYEISVETRQRQRYKKSNAIEISTQTPGFNSFRPGATNMKESAKIASVIDHHLCDAINPIVLVKSPSQCNSWVKMVCPPLPIINQHSRSLGEIIRSFHLQQLHHILVSNPSVFEVSESSVVARASMRQSSVDEKRVNSLLASLEESHFLQLEEGSYGIWQEMFSHISDEFVLSVSVEKLSVDELLEALDLAVRYELWTLVKRYEALLAKRLSGATLLPILRAALGNKASANSSKTMASIDVNASSVSAKNAGLANEPSSPRLHLDLCCACITFLSQHYQQLFTNLIVNNLRRSSSKFFKNKQTHEAELLHSLLQLFGHLFC